MTLEIILATMRAKKWKEAKWQSEALLRLNQVSRVEVLHGSTKTQVPLSAADLPTLLGMLLETLTPTGSSQDATSRSSIRKAITYLNQSSGTNSESGQRLEPAAPSSTPLSKPLSSNRKYWPGEAKDVFWSLVKRLNKYDKENSSGGQMSPLQLFVAEESVRRWWGLENEIDLPAETVKVAAAALGAEVIWVRPESQWTKPAGNQPRKP